MTVTTRHPESKFGFPVILNEEGQVLAPSIGLRLFRHYYGMSAEEIAQVFNVNATKIRSFESGNTAIPCNVLNIMRDYLEDEKDHVMRGGLKIDRRFRTGADLIRRRLARIRVDGISR